MATSDLANELAKPTFRFESTATEKQVGDVIIEQLEDQSSDISALANKWYNNSHLAQIRHIPCSQTRLAHPARENLTPRSRLPAAWACWSTRLGPISCNPSSPPSWTA